MSLTPVLKKRKLASKPRIPVELKKCSECKVYLINDLISPEESKELLSYLHSTYFNSNLSISWTREGRREITQFSNPMNLNYRYSGRDHYGHKMTDVMNALLARVEKETRIKFNYILVNYYKHGGSGLPWHNDREDDLVCDGAIGGLSLGVTREFQFRSLSQPHNQQYHVSLNLKDGSFLMMDGCTQAHHEHRLPCSGMLCVYIPYNIFFRYKR